MEQVEAPTCCGTRRPYRWKGRERLCARPGPVRSSPASSRRAGAVPAPAVVPPWPCTLSGGTVAFGTSHGFGLFDHQQRRGSLSSEQPTHPGGGGLGLGSAPESAGCPSERDGLRPHSRPPGARCTPVTSFSLEGPLSRVKSLKKSLVQSFRRIRRSRVSSRSGGR